MQRPWPSLVSASRFVSACAIFAAFLAGLMLAPLHSCSLAQPGSNLASPAWIGAADNQLRVRLASGLSRVALEAPGGADAFTAGAVAKPVAFTGAVTFELAIDGLRLRAENGAVIGVFAIGSPVVVAPRSDGSVRFDDYATKRIILHPRERRRRTEAMIDVVEVADLDRYLAAVLTAELYPDWSQATYDAQAIAARSYALHERWRRRRVGSRFDVEGDTRDQAYAREASQRAREAVQRTRGKVLTSDGVLLRAYYSSTCGGRPASAADTWPAGPGFEFNLAPPIQGQERSSLCQASPRYRWKVERGRSALARRLAAFGADRGFSIRRLETLANIEPMRRNDAGRPAQYRITDDKGAWWTLSAENLRLALNFQGQGASAVPSGQRVHSGDIEARVEKGAMIIEGRGFGHGVGMCQFGAEALAKQSLSPEEILLFFYPGAQIVALPSAGDAL